MMNAEFQTVEATTMRTPEEARSNYSLLHFEGVLGKLEIPELLEVLVTAVKQKLNTPYSSSRTVGRRTDWGWEPWERGRHGQVYHITA